MDILLLHPSIENSTKNIKIDEIIEETKNTINER